MQRLKEIIDEDGEWGSVGDKWLTYIYPYTNKKQIIEQNKEPNTV